MNKMYLSRDYHHNKSVVYTFSGFFLAEGPG